MMHHDCVTQAVAATVLTRTLKISKGLQYIVTAVDTRLLPYALLNTFIKVNQHHITLENIFFITQWILI